MIEEFMPTTPTVIVMTNSLRRKAEVNGSGSSGTDRPRAAPHDQVFHTEKFSVFFADGRECR
jgi:hypothetical protein